jgi:putative membrane protein
MGWDLVLDPAMAHASLPLKFWTWFESGPYFGMPIKNLGAWFLTGLLFMTVSRRLWGDASEMRTLPIRLPLLLYLGNLMFASTISLSVGLWQPTVLAVSWSLVPLLLSWRQDADRAAGRVATTSQRL